MGKLSDLAFRLEVLERQRDELIDQHSKSDMYVGVEIMTRAADQEDPDETGDAQYETIDVTDFRQHFCHMLIELINKRIDVLKREINTTMFPKPQPQSKE